MDYKLTMFLGLSALLMVLMVGPTDSACCNSVKTCTGWWNLKCSTKCRDGTKPTPCCGYGKCNIFCCNCDYGCRRSKRMVADDEVDTDIERVAEEARGLLELLEEEKEEYAHHRRVFGEHDVDKDSKLSKEEALEMLRERGMDVSNLPADWFTSMDTNGNGYIDPEEYDKDMAKTLE